MEGGRGKEGGEPAEHVCADCLAFERADQPNHLRIAGSNSEMVGPEAMPALGEGIRRRRSVTAARFDFPQQSVARFTLDLLLDHLLRLGPHAVGVLPWRAVHAVGALSCFQYVPGGEKIAFRHHGGSRRDLRLEPAARVRRRGAYLAWARAHAKAGGGDSSLQFGHRDRSLS